MNTLLCSLSLFFIVVPGLLAHPMGNFSVSHYAKLKPTQKGVVDLTYVLDLAEIPTFELLRDWKVDRDNSHAELQNKAVQQARIWLNNLAITSRDTPVRANFQSANIVIADGAGNLPILRITVHAALDTRGGNLQYQDNNYPDRAGWKEIVIDAPPGLTLRKASQSNGDLSQALTHYPPDPTVAPPQDLRAELVWNMSGVPTPATQSVVTRIAQPHSAPAAPTPASMTKQGAPPGAVIRGDYLSRLLHQRELTPWMMLLALACAFALGAAHALTPGHGKSIVAAYLVGSRGTAKHAAFLGVIVTATHTLAVFALGIATLFLVRYVVPEKLTEILGAVSGLSIVAVGAWMLHKRIAGARRPHVHSHGDLTHVHEHHHGSEHHRIHAHPHTHNEPHGHSHMPNELSWGGLAAL
jgi:nickel/cobalt transporter (NicO) family protein